MKDLIKILFLLLMVFCTNSCRKKLRGGCKIKTDTINHDPLADYEDGSCIFVSEVEIFPDSVEKYPVDIYIDNTFRKRLTKYIIPDRGSPIGFIVEFPSNEIHKYRVEDDYGKVWEDTFSAPNQFKGGKTIYLFR